MLEPLPQPDWDRAAIVTGGGRPAERTVPGYAERLARHERGHLGHLARTVRAVPR